MCNILTKILEQLYKFSQGVFTIFLLHFLFCYDFSLYFVMISITQKSRDSKAVKFKIHTLSHFICNILYPSLRILTTYITIHWILMTQGCIHRGDRCDRGRTWTFRYLNPIPTRGGRFCLPSQRSHLNFPCGYVPERYRKDQYKNAYLLFILF